MLIFVYGADTYRSREKLRELRSSFEEKHDPSGMNIVRLDGGASSLDDLSGTLRSQPFFGTGKRMVIAERFLGRHEKKSEQFNEILGAVPETTVLLFWDDLAETAFAKHPVAKSFKKSPAIAHYSFEPLSGAALTRWVKEEVEREKGIIAARATTKLVEEVGGDLWKLSSEIQKLLAYRQGEEIREEDVLLLTEGVVEENVFSILDAFSDRDAASASRQIRTQIAGGLEAMQLFAMLTRQVRILIQVRSYLSQTPGAGREELARSLGLHPFVAEKARRAASTFPPRMLLDLLDKLFSLERMMKTGKVSPGLAIDQVLAAVAA